MANEKHKVIAIESFAGVLDDGTEVRATKGVTIVDAGGRVHRKWPDFFGAIDAAYPDVEEATAEPGHKRGDR